MRRRISSTSFRPLSCPTKLLRCWKSIQDGNSLRLVRGSFWTALMEWVSAAYICIYIYTCGGDAVSWRPLTANASTYAFSDKIWKKKGKRKAMGKKEKRIALARNFFVIKIHILGKNWGLAFYFLPSLQYPLHVANVLMTFTADWRFMLNETCWRKCFIKTGFEICAMRSTCTIACKNYL